MEHVEAASCQDDAMTARIPLAISSVPMQRFVNVANAADGLKMGTIFEDLYLNFYCTECRTCGCGQNQYARCQDYSGAGYMSGNTGRNGRNYNNNVNTGCGCSYHNRGSAGRGNNYNNSTNASCDHNYNAGSGMGCSGCRNSKRSGCRMNNCDCQL